MFTDDRVNYVVTTNLTTPKSLIEEIGLMIYNFDKFCQFFRVDNMFRPSSTFNQLF